MLHGDLENFKGYFLVKNNLLNKGHNDLKRQRNMHLYFLFLGKQYNITDIVTYLQQS